MSFIGGPLPNSGIFAPDAGDAMDGGGSLPSGSGIVDPPSSGSNRRSRKEKYRDAFDAASKFKESTKYKAKTEAEEKEKARAQRATLKLDDNTAVMEGFTDEPFTLKGVEGTRGRLLGTIGSAVGGYAFGPLGGQIGGAIGSSFG
jgi:hypothetical protein